MKKLMAISCFEKKYDKINEERSICGRKINEESFRKKAIRYGGDKNLS
jgi:hypothetical protein